MFSECSKVVRSIFFGVFLVGISFCFTSVAHSQDYDFRHAKWGMSMQEVKTTENGEPISEFSKGEVLTYTSTLLGEKVVIVYAFAFNKLVRSKYMLAKYSKPLWSILFKSFPQPELSKGYFVLDFDKFKKELTEKYGKPFEEGWGYKREDLNLVELELFEKAIRAGEGGISAKWKTDKTNIRLFVFGAGGEIKFEIGYSSRELESLEKKDGL